MSMLTDISCGSKDNGKECLANAKLVSLCTQKDLEQDNGHLLVLVLRKSGILSVQKFHKVNGTKLQKGCCWNLVRADVQLSVLRPPLSRGHLKSKGHGKTVNTLCSRFGNGVIIVSANQLSLYGAVAEICEECESLHERTGRPVVMGQSSSSLVPSVIKTEVPLDCDDPANKDLPLQQYGERIERLSQQDKLSKFCMDAGFLSVVEIGQYFRTEDTADLSQFHAVACRECTLPREEEASQPKGWIRGHTKSGLVLEVATCCLHGEYGVEIRIMSLNNTNFHSWVRISHGSSKLVKNLNNSEQETSEVQLEEYALKLNASDFACRSKAKAKPQRRELAGPSTRTTKSASRRRWSSSYLEN